MVRHHGIDTCESANRGKSIRKAKSPMIRCRDRSAPPFDVWPSDASHVTRHQRCGKCSNCCGWAGTPMAGSTRVEGARCRTLRSHAYCCAVNQRWGQQGLGSWPDPHRAVLLRFCNQSVPPVAATKWGTSGVVASSWPRRASDRPNRTPCINRCQLESPRSVVDAGIGCIWYGYRKRFGSQCGRPFLSHTSFGDGVHYPCGFACPRGARASRSRCPGFCGWRCRLRARRLPTRHQPESGRRKEELTQ